MHIFGNNNIYSSTNYNNGGNYNDYSGTGPSAGWKPAENALYFIKRTKEKIKQFSWF